MGGTRVGKQAYVHIRVTFDIYLLLTNVFVSIDSFYSLLYVRIDLLISPNLSVVIDC